MYEQRAYLCMSGSLTLEHLSTVSIWLTCVERNSLFYILIGYINVDILTTHRMSSIPNVTRKGGYQADGTI